MKQLIMKNKIPKSFYLVLIIAAVVILVIFIQSKLPVNQESQSNTQVTSQPATTSVESQNHTSGWKIYTNNRFNYQVKYPSDWFIEETTQLITTIRPWKKQPNEYSDPLRDIDITVYPYKEYWPNFEKWIVLGKMRKKGELIIGGEKAEEFQEIAEQGYTYRHIIIQKNEHLYCISIYEKHPQIEIFNQILKTFEFIQ